jgi:hypothetical protein
LDTAPDFPPSAIDGFEIWAEHYERFNSRSMASRVRSIRKIFNGLIDKGLPGKGICLLDHGVCGGLLQLAASTYYYRLRAQALEKVKTTPVFSQCVIDAGDWSPLFWWTGIVWGTAAVAVHNIQQLASARELATEWPGALALDEDPLAYLGVMVDIIQEWDRYAVFKDLDREPIQGIEVKIGLDPEKTAIEFLEPFALKRAQKLRKDLSDFLEGWEEVVTVRPGPG